MQEWDLKYIYNEANIDIYFAEDIIKLIKGIAFAMNQNMK